MVTYTLTNNSFVSIALPVLPDYVIGLWTVCQESHVIQNDISVSIHGTLLYFIIVCIDKLIKAMGDIQEIRYSMSLCYWYSLIR